VGEVLTGAVAFPVLRCALGMLISFFIAMYVYMTWYPSDRDVEIVVVLGDYLHHSAKPVC
jgi:hypothetical protein